MRYALQRVLTGEWLTRDLDGFSDGQQTRTLSGPGGINGFIRPDMRELLAADGEPLLWEWGTIIYAEIDGRIRSAGIIEKIDYDDQGRLTLEAPGFSRYAQGIPYAHTFRGVHIDPGGIPAMLWADVQINSFRNLGVTIDTFTTPESSWIGDNENPYVLAWYNSVDCGGEIDNLAKQIPFDYIEQHTYTDDLHSAVSHHIKIGYPRLGRRRTDLRFADGENIVSLVPVGGDGGEYADELWGIGRGEGSAMVHATAVRRQGRLSRPKIITDKTADQARLDALLAAELVKRADVKDITEITIRDHVNAPLTAIDPGDDILVQATVSGLGPTRLWVRVLAITEVDKSPTQAVLSTQRSDSFTYNATTEVS
jgi:hypothetical protein